MAIFPVDSFIDSKIFDLKLFERILLKCRMVFRDSWRSCIRCDIVATFLKRIVEDSMKVLHSCYWVAK